MIPAILRNEIIQKHPSHKNPPLVYQATSSENDLINILQQVSSEKFFVLVLTAKNLIMEMSSFLPRQKGDQSQFWWSGRGWESDWWGVKSENQERRKDGAVANVVEHDEAAGHEWGWASPMWACQVAWTPLFVKEGLGEIFLFLSRVSRSWTRFKSPLPPLRKGGLA